MLTPEQLAEIKARADRHRLKDALPIDSHPDLLDLNRLIDTDVPALLAEVERLTARLKAAEDVCVLYGWTGDGNSASPRGKAQFVVWQRWYDLVGPAFLTPDAHPDLSDEEIARLAAQRDETRARALARLRGEG